MPCAGGNIKHVPVRLRVQQLNHAGQAGSFGMDSAADIGRDIVPKLLPDQVVFHLLSSRSAAQRGDEPVRFGQEG